MGEERGFEVLTTEEEWVALKAGSGDHFALQVRCEKQKQRQKQKAQPQPLQQLQKKQKQPQQPSRPRVSRTAAEPKLVQAPLSARRRAVPTSGNNCDGTSTTIAIGIGGSMPPSGIRPSIHVRRNSTQSTAAASCAPEQYAICNSNTIYISQLKNIPDSLCWFMRVETTRNP